MEKETFIKKLDTYFKEKESNELLIQTMNDIAKYFESINDLIKNPAEKLEINFDDSRAKRLSVSLLSLYVHVERFEKRIIFVYGSEDMFGLIGARGQVGAPELTFSLENEKLLRDSDKKEFSTDFLDDLLEHLLPNE